MKVLAALLAVVALVVAVVAGATKRFRHQVEHEARALLTGARGPVAGVVEHRDLDGLPAPVRRWLEVSGAVGHAQAATVRLKQRGEFRTAPDRRWMPVVAEQYYSVDPPGFVWSVKARMMGVLPISGRDRYADGHGQMLIKVASLFTAADAAGPEVDQAALLRYLGEIAWFPSAALGDTITWEEIDGHSARATMSYAGVKASMEFSFDDRGRLVSQTAERFMSSGPNARREKWFVPVTAWRTIRGVEIPVRGDVVWKLAGGDFNYFRWEILDVEVNHPALYADPPGPPEEP